MAGAITPSEYIQHHLTNWTFGKHPDGHWGFAHNAEEVAQMVVYLCAPEGDYVTGAELEVNGGLFM